MTICGISGSPAFNTNDCQPYGYINNSIVTSFNTGQQPTSQE
jgi:hypothetical protein